MSSRDTGAARVRSRRSIAHVPRSRMTSGLDKENATTDIGAVTPFEPNTKPAMKDKKSRSKSLGPGGLDALQNSNGNRRQSTASFPLKSILKPTVPVSPVRNIPSFEETRRRTPARKAQSLESSWESSSQNQEGLLIDFATPPRPAAEGDDTANPFDTFNATSAIREEMAATKERDDKERRERERQAILEKRAARRKSMANRRVSFAPEATLHTWNVVEIPDDSTSSSAANSTRRASTAKNSEPTAQAPSPAKDAPSSPETDAGSDFGFSPVRQQDLELIRGRSGSSGEDEGPAEMFSSPFSGSSPGSEDTGAPSLGEVEEDDGHTSESDDGFDAESTAMSIDDMTARSGVSVQSDVSSSSSSSARLNDALRQAAKEAGTQAVDEEDGEMSMEIADQEITGAFQPWIKKGQRQSFDWSDISARNDQENTEPSKVASENDAPGSDEMDEDEEMSMDVTNAIGRILGKSSGHRKSAVRRQSTAQQSEYDDQTMEMTNVVGGGIERVEYPRLDDNDNADEDEEMTMEFTSAIGKVLSKGPSYGQGADVEAEQFATDTTKSDRMTDDKDKGSDDGMDMEMTSAVGGILPSGLETQDKVQAKRLMELEAESGQLNSSPFQEITQKSPAKSPLSFHVAAVASEHGSPSLASVKSRTPQRSSLLEESKTPESNNPRRSPRKSPTKKPLTPPKQSTPQTKPATPSKTPPSANVSFRSASPKKLFRPELQLQRSAEKKKSPRLSIFEHGTNGGSSTPRIVLQPREARRSSGLGIDKEGLGSPRVVALLDKRLSLGENTPQFVPQQQPRGAVRFENPLKMQADEERDREEEELREDGHIQPANPTNSDIGSNLRNMISSMSPKKGRIGSRKSLHVGAARGILGKRPAELDSDEDEVENSPKRLRGHDVSPVKAVRLPAPSSAKKDPTRRSILSPVRRARSSSPLKGSTTPTQQPQSASKKGITPLKEGVDSLHIASDPQQSEPEEGLPDQEPEPEVEPIQLQDFLNMTNIHFMELTTTKRRHTTAPGSATRRLSRRSGEHVAKAGTFTFDDCVAAALCTVPMLELYQHSCRELKSYISEGRQVIRSIEAETYTENPPLFREYVTAPPDIRVIMDNQFRNVKTHARLLSKATWYEWRMKLLEGLKEGLIRHVDDMKADDVLLSKREEILNNIVPPLAEKQTSLEQEAENLRQLVEEMETCDQDELRGTREKLSTVDDEIEAKQRELEQLQAEVQEKTEIIDAGTEMSNEFLGEIQEAERIKEECRGWSARDINELKNSVQRIERQTGWSILSASFLPGKSADPMLVMSYQGQLQIKFHPGAFATKTSNGTEKTNRLLELSSVKGKTTSPIASFALQSMQKHLSTINQSKTAPNELLRFISSAWDRTGGLENEARMLEFCGVTRLTLSEPINSSLFLRARCTVLGHTAVPSSPSRKASAAKKTGTKRIDVDFNVRTRISTWSEDAKEIGTLDFRIDAIATKVYGFGTGNKSGLSGKEMEGILGKGLSLGDGAQLGNGVWCKAVRMLTGSAF